MNHHSWKRIGIELLVIFVLSLTPLLWFREGTLFLGHDNTFPLVPQTFLENRLTTWTENFFGHDQSLILGTIPIHFIDAIPSFMGVSLLAGQKMIYVFWFFLIGLSAYTLARTLKSDSRLFRFTAIILYQFNFFILQGWWIGEKSKFSAYIALPLILSVFFAVTRGKLSVFMGAVLTSLILFVFNAGGLYGIPLYGGAFIAVGTLLVLKVFDYWHAKNSQAIRLLVVYILSVLILSVLANAYFLIPAFAKVRSRTAPGIETIGGVSGVISWASEISANTSFLNLFRLEGIPEWYDNPEHPYAKHFLENPILIAVSFLWPVLVLAALFVAKKTDDNRIVVYFFIVYLIGIFFSAGTHPPLGFLYQFFVERIPGFVIFRTPYYKFAPAVFLSTSFLIAYLVDRFSGRSKPIIFSIVIAIVFFYHFPFFSGNFFAWRSTFSTRLNVPSYVYEFGDWLNEEKSDDGRVLLLPPNSQDLLYTAYQWGYLSFQALPTLLSSKSVVVNNDQVNVSERAMLMSLYVAIERRDETFIKKLASMLSISYVLLQRDAVSDPRAIAPIDVAAYTQAVRGNSQFVFLRSFGQWDLFSFSEMPRPKFYMTNSLVSLHGDVKELDPYYSFMGDTNTFVDSGSVDQLHATEYVSDFVVPTCLTCPFKNRPVISFPERNILPDDPFYQVVLFLENRRPIPKAPKAAIYHLLGITLKRVSEINEVLFRQKSLTKDMVDRYTALLRTIQENFGQLSSLQEKIEVATNVRHYLRAERNFLRPNLNKNVPAGGQTVLAGQIFGEISRVEKQFGLPELVLDDTKSRVYQFSLARERDFEVLVRTEEFRGIVSIGSELSVAIDNNIPRQLRVTEDIFERPWLSFGSLQLASGFHTLKLSFPVPPGSLHKLTPVETEFSVAGENTCFGSRVENVDSQKLYKLNLLYANDFSDNLLLFIWDQEVATRKLKNAVKLAVSGLAEKNEQIVEASAGTKEILIALCAPNLTQELINKQFQVRMSEILVPAILLYPPEAPKHIAMPVSFQHMSTTRYRVSDRKEIATPKVLVFSERYDDWWELRGVKAQHVRANGYANAWIIEDNHSGDEITISYKGEKYFYYGKLVSLITIFGGILYLGLRILKSVRHHD